MDIGCRKCGLPLHFDRTYFKLTCLNKECKGYKKNA